MVNIPIVDRNLMDSYEKINKPPSKGVKLTITKKEGNATYELHERVSTLSFSEQKDSYRAAVFSMIFTAGLAWVFSPRVRSLLKEGKTGQRRELVYLKSTETKEGRTFEKVLGSSGSSKNSAGKEEGGSTQKTSGKQEGAVEDASQKKALSEEEKRAQHQKNIDEYKEKVGFTEVMPMAQDLDPASKEGKIQDRILFGFNSDEVTADNKPWSKLNFEEQKEFYKEAVRFGLKEKIDYNIKNWEISTLEQPENIGVKYPNYSKSETSFFEKIKGDEEFIKELKEPEKKEKAPAALKGNAPTVPVDKKAVENLENPDVQEIIKMVNEGGYKYVLDQFKTELSKTSVPSKNKASERVNALVNKNGIETHLKNYIDSKTLNDDIRKLAYAKLGSIINQIEKQLPRISELKSLVPIKAPTSSKKGRRRGN